MWNATAHPVAATTLPELFAAQARRTPDAIAVIFEDRALRYAELEAHSNQLAHHLRAKGVGPETVVGLLIERSPEMVIGLLGILKAGAAYLPLDPSYPAERLAFMLADAKAAVLVTQGALHDGSPSGRPTARGRPPRGRRRGASSTPTGPRSRASPHTHRRRRSTRSIPPT